MNFFLSQGPIRLIIINFMGHFAYNCKIFKRVFAHNRKQQIQIFFRKNKIGNKFTM